MHNAPKPAGGQPANLPAEISAKPAKATLAMSVHIPDDWNPHAELLSIADYARDLCQRADKWRDKAAEIERALDAEDCPNEDEAQEAMAEAAEYRSRARIEIEAVRDINHRVCILAMRLSACRITINRGESK